MPKWRSTLRDLYEAIINDIKSHISVDIKYLDLVSCFNGVNILQTDEYIKMYCTAYIKKIYKGHKAWMTPNTPSVSHPKNNLRRIQ